eukprot:GEZU01010750.1.p1 GENE.GEZU01010750.1~~GEZU01010750.1.p1  ORF type:complete len:138 (+),score=36.56 GEZU01010750.1:70-483(+)
MFRGSVGNKGSLWSRRVTPFLKKCRRYAAGNPDKEEPRNIAQKVPELFRTQENKKNLKRRADFMMLASVSAAAAAVGYMLYGKPKPEYTSEYRQQKATLDLMGMGDDKMKDKILSEDEKRIGAEAIEEITQKSGVKK